MVQHTINIINDAKIAIKSTLEAEPFQIAMCKINNRFVKYSLKLDYASVEKINV